tara:strand:- start:1469 stop:2074 length:606 start_codon:yes stop_codon:yes gene_type:complete
MAIVNGYCTLAQAKAALRITDNTDDSLLESAIESASRRVDGHCGRWFYKTAATPVAVYPLNLYTLVFPDDVSSTTNLSIAIDTTGDGTYDTTLTLNTDYIVYPTDANLRGYPYHQAVMTSGETFPLYVTPSFPTAQVTAEWGWAAVPSDVTQACILLTIRQFARLNAALGVVGFADMAIAVRAVDPDVRDLLAPYVVMGIA